MAAKQQYAVINTTNLTKHSFMWICRTCLSTKQSFNIFNMQYEGTSILDIFNSYIAVQIEEKDDLPQNICISCINSIVHIYSFIQQCEKSNALLRAVTKQWKLDENNKKQESLRLQAFETNFSDEIDYDIKLENLDEDKIAIAIKSDGEETIPTNTNSQCEGINIEPFNSLCDDSNNIMNYEENIENDEQSHNEVADIDLKMKTNKCRFYCNICKEGFDTCNELKYHKRVVHPKPRNYKCPTCGKLYFSQNILMKHMECHIENSSSYPSDFLTLDNPIDATEIADILLKSNKNCLNIYPCKHCNKFLTTYEALTDHQKYITYSDLGTISYRTCKDPENEQNSHISDHFYLKCASNERDTHNNVQLSGILMTEYDEINRNNGLLKILKTLIESNTLYTSVYLCKQCPEFFDIQKEYNIHLINKHSSLFRHKCIICFKKFSAEKNLKRHMKVHDVQKKRSLILQKQIPTVGYEMEAAELKQRLLQLKRSRINLYPCKHCNKFFISRGRIQLHQYLMKLTQQEQEIDMNKAEDEKLNKENQLNNTNEIGETYDNTSGYKNMDSETDDSNLSTIIKKIAKSDNRVTLFCCIPCVKFFETQEEYRTHSKAVKHPRQRKKICKICTKSFLTYSNLNLHMRTHTHEKPYKCNICSVQFSFSTSLKRHMMIHTGERPHVCHVCGKGYIQLVQLQQHMLVHTGECSYLCNYCGYNFKHYSTFLRHIEKNHPTGETKKAFKNSNTIIRNKKCDVCQKKFATNAILKVHMMSHKMEALLCNYCGKSFYYPSGLATHLKIHTAPKSHKCSICSKGFTQQNYLKTHMRMHTGERPFECKLCLKRFKQRNHVSYHMQSMHSNVKPFQCFDCGKCFTFKGNLKEHMRIHTGETPYTCNFCDKGFYHKNNMKKHIEIHKKVAANTKRNASKE